MFYIITYASHSENYFELLKTYPNLIILGYCKKWNGFQDKVNATVSFCKKINKDDIVCFVDGFDSIILENSSEILKRYKELNKDLIFSNEANFKRGKYALDRIFGTCNNKRLNSGLYIGKAYSIINVWKDFKKNMDDQYFITKKCSSNSNIYIDDTHYIFHNHSELDKIEIKNKKLYINNNKYNVCILGAPGNGDIIDILKKLGHKNINYIKKNKKRILYTLKTHFTKFIPEVILFILLILIFYFFRWNNLLTYFIAFFIISIFLEFFINTKFLNISNKKKLLYTIIDIIHVFFTIAILYIILILYLDIFKLKCNLKLFLILNITILIIIFLFFIFKRCFLSILADKLKNKTSSWKNPIDRIKYLFNNDTMYSEENKNNGNYTIAWMKKNTSYIFLLIILNIYFIIKI